MNTCLIWVLGNGENIIIHFHLKIQWKRQKILLQILYYKENTNDNTILQLARNMLTCACTHSSN